METTFYLAAAVAVAATVLVVTRLNAVHALLYLIVSLLAVALLFLSLGAPFAAALEVLLYAGAIMVLFVFVIMMLNLGPQTVGQEKAWLKPRMWAGPAALALVLAAELVWVFAVGAAGLELGRASVGPKEVGLALYGPYLLGVEMASFLLLAGLVGAFHLGRRARRSDREGGQNP